MRRGYIIALAVISAVSVTTSSAEDAKATPAPAVRWSSSAGTEMLLRRGQERKFQTFARAQIDVAIVCTPCDDPFHLFIRADKSVLTSETPDLFGAATSTVQFDTLEAYGGAYRRVFGPLSLTGFYGYIVPLQPSKAPGSYPQTYGAGVILGDPTSGRWLLLTAGHHDVAGAGLKALFAGQLPIDGRLTVVADGALGKVGGFVRVGVVVALEQ